MTRGDWEPLLDDLAARRRAALEMGGPDKLAKHRASGKLTARERIAVLCDPGTFVEIGALAGSLPADAFVAGSGLVEGRPVLVGAEDFTVAGGSIGAANTAKRNRVAALAAAQRCPLVMMLEGAGHRPPMPDDPPSTARPTDLQPLAELRGIVPQATAVLGPSAGHGALAAPMADFSVMTERAAIFAAGPPLVKASLGEDVDAATLGGPAVALASGLIHNVAPDDATALAMIRQWLSYLPPAAGDPLPLGPAEGRRVIDDLIDLVPRNPRQAYDMVDVITRVVDHDTWFEIQPRFGPSLLTGLARLGGRTVAIIANQPRSHAGAITADAAMKAADFITNLEPFAVPLVFLTDNPGVLAGTASEQAGILRAAARMYAAQHRSRSAKLQVTLRKAYGFGSSVMAMNPFDGQTLSVAFPGVTFGGMPARGADAAMRATAEDAAAMVQAELASGYRSAHGLSIDDLIDPRHTRNVLLDALRLVR